MREILKEEISQVAHMLASSFANYEQIEAMFGGLENRDWIIQKFFETQMNALFTNGTILVTNDLNSACYGYDSKKTSFLNILMKSAFYLIPITKKLSPKDKETFKHNSTKTEGTNNPFWHKKFVKGRYYHILIIGIAPTVQGKGYLRKLLTPIINRCNQVKIPVVLDTHRKKNVEIYQHFGFQLVKTEISKDGSLTRYCMIHYPQ